MPDETIQQTEIQGDILADDFKPATPEVTETPNDPVDPVTPPPPDFKGLPFQKTEDLVAAYKQLQDAYTEGRVDYYDLKRQLNELLPLVQQAKGEAPTQPTEEEITAAIADFFKKGPKATLDAIIRPFQERLDKLTRENETATKERDLTRFLNENQSLTEEDELRLLQIIKTTPRINQMGTIYEQLDAAMDRLIRLEPTRFSSREKKGEISTDLTNAKKGASTLGGKAGGKGTVAPKDEFDDILEASAAQKARWR